MSGARLVVSRSIRPESVEISSTLTDAEDNRADVLVRQGRSHEALPLLQSRCPFARGESRKLGRFGSGLAAELVARGRA